MSTNEVDASTRPAPPSSSSEPGGPGAFADRWPFRRKLNVLVGVPLAVVAVLLTYLIADQVGQARDAASAARLVRDSAQVAALVDRVEAEHQQAILLSVRFESQGPGARPPLTAYRRAQAAVDAQVTRVRQAFGDRLPDTEAQAIKEIEGLTSLRQTIEQSYLPADNIDPAYTGAAKNLIDGLGLDRNAALAATFTGNLLDSLLRADAAHSSFETSVFSATTGDSNALIEFTAAVGSYQLYTYQADRFARFATEAQADQLAEMEHSAAQRRIAEAYAELQIDPSGLQAGTPAEIRQAFRDALNDYPAYTEQAAERLRIASSLIDQIADHAAGASSDAWWRAAALLGAALIGFLLWLGFSVAVRRSVVRPVQALTGAAQEVSAATSRELARVADDDADDSGPPRLRDVPVTARDEIGDLAEAFNQVQTTAAALLERQVLSRRNVAEMFGNVGRRVSNLTTRQLALIDAVERGETDPALLERLYSIDHIAVRLRRNADSLMLLAGIRETVLDSGPTELTNVVRAALGQIEGYQRVQLYAGTEIMVEPDIIGDLTLMVAELLENAVSFSPAGSPVEVSVRAGGDGASIVVADHGLGMSAERLAEENARLIRRERLDVVPTKVLGLFVVGTLARRWDITAALSRTPGGGVTAEVTIPSTLLLTMSPMTTPAQPTTTVVGGTTPAPDADTAAATAGDTAGATSAAPHADSGTASRTGSEADPGPASRPDSEAASRAGSGADASPDRTDAVAAARAADSGRRPASERPATDETSALPRRLPRREAPATKTSPEADAPAPQADTPAAAPEPRPAADRPATDDASTLPHRLPRRDAPALAEDSPAPPESGAPSRADGQPFIPRARTDSETPSPEPAPSPASPRPLRRRVRGATLRTSGEAGAQQGARQGAVGPADAEAVRSALEEFEAAVARAQRDSDTGTHERPADPTTSGSTPAAPRTNDRHDRNDRTDLPEGAEQ
ncbi:ATP-binding protein [Streptomyces anandii]|uniref:sensor histidine kinase n=1 Tax=Streptomyces anandii TaxID=285454 RepID=UPI0036FC03CF